MASRWWSDTLLVPPHVGRLGNILPKIDLRPEGSLSRNPLPLIQPLLCGHEAEYMRARENGKTPNPKIAAKAMVTATKQYSEYLASHQHPQPTEEKYRTHMRAHADTHKTHMRARMLTFKCLVCKHPNTHPPSLTPPQTPKQKNAISSQE